MNYPQFVGSAYRSQSVNADCQVTRNWYVEVLEDAGSKSRTALYPTPGQTTLVTAATHSSNRGLFELDGRAWTQIGPDFYEISSSFVLTNRGATADSAKLVTICGSGQGGHQLMITTARNVWIYDTVTNTLTQIAAMVGHADQGGFLDGRFIALDAEAAEVYICNYFNGLVWPATLKIQRSTQPDKWVGMVVHNKEIWLFGTKTTDVYVNTGASPFPFEPLGGIFIEYGIAAAFSACGVAGALVWLTRNEAGQGIVVRADGYQPVRVSTHALELEIASYDNIEDAEAFSYQQDGHEFYVLNFPSANKTWVLDATSTAQLGSPQWHERTTRVAPGVDAAWSVRTYANVHGVPTVGERANTGRINELSLSVFTEADGTLIRRTRRAPHINKEGDWISYSSFQVDCETGVGLQTGQGQNPMLMVRWSDDGGHTWSNEKLVPLGRVGKYKTRAIVRRCGRSRDRVFEVSISDPVAPRLTGAWLKLRGMAA